MVLRRTGLTGQDPELIGSSQVFSVGTRPFCICGFPKGLARDRPKFLCLASESLMKEEGISTGWSPVPGEASMWGNTQQGGRGIQSLHLSVNTADTPETLSHPCSAVCLALSGALIPQDSSKLAILISKMTRDLPPLGSLMGWHPQKGQGQRKALRFHPHHQAVVCGQGDHLHFRAPRTGCGLGSVMCCISF